MDENLITQNKGVSPSPYGSDVASESTGPTEDVEIVAERTESYEEKSNQENQQFILYK